MDTGKGLISSSSSSTLPTPPPLPEELRSKIIDLGNTSSTLPNPYILFPDILEPVKCVDPDDPSSWKDLIEEDDCFLSDIRLFSPNQLPLVPGFEIDGNSVFELYSIQITKLDPLRNFSSIYMEGTNTHHEPMIIYKRPQGEDIPLHQPLLLQNIFRPPSAENDVTIALSNPAGSGWALRYGPPLFHPENMEYGKHTKVVTDKFTESEAIINYELIESAAVAELEFTFLADRKRPIKIFFGSITATTNGDPFTERIIRQFSSSEPSVLQTNETVPVNRSVFGVPLGKSLYIHVTFEVAVGRISKIIGETIQLSAPNETKSEERYITIIKGKGKFIMMRVKVSWWDFMV